MSLFCRTPRFREKPVESGVRLHHSFWVLILCASIPHALSGQRVSPPNPQDAASNGNRSVEWRTFVPNLLDDQKRTFGTFPSHLTHRRNWIPVLAIGAASAGLVVADQYDSRYFRRTTNLSTFNSALSSTNTAAAIVLTPVALYSIGHFSKSNYTKETALLTAESALDGEVIDIVMKLVSDRRRPISIPKTSNFADSFLEGNNHFNGSFPSSHTVAAFSVATVVSRRYGARHKWVPIVAYGLSAAIGFSKISTSAHFPSDVFLGAAIGYSVARFAVLRQ